LKKLQTAATRAGRLPVFKDRVRKSVRARPPARKILGAKDRKDFSEIVAVLVSLRSSWLPIDEAICIALSNRGYHLERRDSRVGRMLISKLLQTRKTDAELPKEIRAALIESLFAPIASLIVGAVACSIVGATIALRVGDAWIMANSIAILAVGMLRVVSAVLYRRSKEADRLVATRVWERVYE